MTTTKPVSFKSLLKEAKANGCVNVKIQILENWKEVMEDVIRESDNSAAQRQGYKVVQIKTRIDKDIVISKIVVRIQGDTLIVRVALQDGNFLLKGLK